MFENEGRLGTCLCGSVQNPEKRKTNTYFMVTAHSTQSDSAEAPDQRSLPPPGFKLLIRKTTLVTNSINDAFVLICWEFAQWVIVFNFDIMWLFH